MHNLKLSLLLLGALGLSSCGLLRPPAASKPTGPVTETTPDITPMGTAPLCSNVAAGGNYPYGSAGPIWRQWIYVSDNGAPLNYSTFTTDLRPAPYFKLTDYTINAAGNKAYPAPLNYQYLYSPTFSIPGKLVGADNTQNVALSNVYLNGSVSYGLIYQATTKDYSLPVISTANTYKLVNPDGSIQSTINPAGQTVNATVDGNQVRLPGGQQAKLEFYLDPTVKTRPEVIQANYKDPATGATKNDWVKVDMPYQEGYLKVTTPSYTVYEPTGAKTYNTATNPLPNFKFMLRGYNNASTTDRRFLSHLGIYYSRPYGIGTDQASLNTWLDGRSDFMLQWNMFNRQVARATLDASQNPVLVAGTSTTPANWNLGTPGYANDKNCISKSIAPENTSTAVTSVVQPLAPVQSIATLNDTQQGLRAEYFDNPDFTSKRVERLSAGINFNWGGWSPAPYIAPETYSVRWSGSITPSFNETYTFYFTGGHGIRLRVNHKIIIDQWDSATPVNALGSITLKGDQKVDLQIEYKHNTGNAQAKLEWESVSQARQVIPTTLLKPLPIVQIPLPEVLHKRVPFTMENISGAATVLSPTQEVSVNATSKGVYVPYSPTSIARVFLLDSSGKVIGQDVVIGKDKQELQFNRYNSGLSAVFMHFFAQYLPYQQRLGYYQFLKGRSDVTTFLSGTYTSNSLNEKSSLWLKEYLEQGSSIQVTKQTIIKDFDLRSMNHLIDYTASTQTFGVWTQAVIAQRFFVFPGDRDDIRFSELNSYNQSIMCEPSENGNSCKNPGEPTATFAGTPPSFLLDTFGYALYAAVANNPDSHIKMRLTDPNPCGVYTVVASGTVGNRGAPWDDAAFKSPLTENVLTALFPMIEFGLVQSGYGGNHNDMLQKINGLVDAFTNDFTKSLLDLANDHDVSDPVAIYNAAVGSLGAVYASIDGFYQLAQASDGSYTRETFALDAIRKHGRLTADAFEASMARVNLLENSFKAIQVLAIFERIATDAVNDHLMNLQIYANDHSANRDPNFKPKSNLLTAKFSTGDPFIFAKIYKDGRYYDENTPATYDMQAESRQSETLVLKNLGCRDLTYSVTPRYLGVPTSAVQFKNPQAMSGIVAPQGEIRLDHDIYCDREFDGLVGLVVKHNDPTEPTDSKTLPIYIKCKGSGTVKAESPKFYGSGKVEWSGTPIGKITIQNVHATLPLRFSVDASSVSWLTVEGAGTRSYLNPGETATVNLIGQCPAPSASVSAPSTHSATLVVRSSDPTEPTSNVFVQLVCSPLVNAASFNAPVKINATSTTPEYWSIEGIYFQFFSGTTFTGNSQRVDIKASTAGDAINTAKIRADQLIQGLTPADENIGWMPCISNPKNYCKLMTWAHWLSWLKTNY
ncbi:PA14 domain-containing protein [Deinococcus roseus]|uniref:PA14 domain-containing protein n=1 Tax=Deinococcus roseus TaxID=392414 RepID=A0ABQ2CW99_9DEIO|nr:PA14 domain-containing protein [Deinococcus roseus]GGJ27016.1 hypothetical protein GCM10008938_11430 [Deinococcus roseus]